MTINFSIRSDNERVDYKAVVAGSGITITDDNGTVTIAATGGGGGEAFPVGAVYLNITGVDPATELGYGTWSQIAQGQFLVGQNGADPDFDIAEETGGAKTHTHAEHPALSHAGGAVGTIAASGAAAEKKGTAGATCEPSGHTHPAPSFTQPDQHAAQGHDSPSHLPPYYVVYVWKRTA